jgi:hypothetical protein
MVELGAEEILEGVLIESIVNPPLVSVLNSIGGA